jgi:hypothetical protein
VSEHIHTTTQEHPLSTTAFQPATLKHPAVSKTPLVPAGFEDWYLHQSTTTGRMYGVVWLYEGTHNMRRTVLVMEWGRPQRCRVEHGAWLGITGTNPVTDRLIDELDLVP